MEMICSLIIPEEFYEAYVHLYHFILLLVIRLCAFSLFCSFYLLVFPFNILMILLSFHVIIFQYRSFNPGRSCFAIGDIHGHILFIIFY